MLSAGWPVPCSARFLHGACSSFRRRRRALLFPPRCCSSATHPHEIRSQIHVPMRTDAARPRYLLRRHALWVQRFVQVAPSATMDRHCLPPNVRLWSSARPLGILFTLSLATSQQLHPTDTRTGARLATVTRAWPLRFASTLDCRRATDATGEDRKAIGGLGDAAPSLFG